ncbi:hypothetical protein OsI_15452 [Oryza sativa Indica Group]|uniref:OSJNBa0038P21.19 protein n=2 Tax=Oryza sativa TaxID=4530 RepID=Q7X758_ORYSJ|nr:hypothetical protein OsI_15452 [Oryza sativa Indica Group]EAZ30335.1 hypothetical protein OsJ_14382 [Oryza sativa Japonica Group]CAE05526.1 OSJNBa0038P21.19 [Oryza sativa Japonica Group]
MAAAAATTTMTKLVLVVVVLLHVSGVLAAAARTLPGEEWLMPEAGGVVRTVVEMLVGSKSGGNGSGTCC